MDLHKLLKCAQLRSVLLTKNTQHSHTYGKNEIHNSCAVRGFGNCFDRYIDCILTFLMGISKASFLKLKALDSSLIGPVLRKFDPRL